MRRMILAGLSAVAVALTLSACTTGPAASSVEVAADTIVLDVRTADEYAGGHLEGAELLDFNAGEVAAAIPTLDPEAEYVVYCRSGNRAGQAIKLMEQAGFTKVTNLGSLEQAAAATGIEVVR
ncbi:rhodanese-like domain-containing protein [Leucobacter salsicius]|uniref:rhodanese-like domain-containing protein n=1 Tax=Leucobacter salsicius TaxID=664638 RepID=UPI0003478A26|nr:rhodanese-like domain-containing protein [Leucobacter salsicius]